MPFWLRYRYCHQRKVLDFIVSNCLHFGRNDKLGCRAIGGSVRGWHFGAGIWEYGEKMIVSFDCDRVGYGFHSRSRAVIYAFAF